MVILSVLIRPASAQEQGGMQMPMPDGHEHQMTPVPENPLGIDHARNGSGTSWLPDASPMQGHMTHRGPWMLMLHGNAFVQYVEAGSDRGDGQLGSINWVMGMAQREVGGGQLLLKTMVSAEPATVGRCGYPTLLASGEQCRGVPLHDRQHPHDLFMEIAAQYRRSVSDTLAIEVYAGLAGDPALGPTAFPHRLSALPNPIAPVSHHWLDSTHVSFGVVTGGLYGHRWKAEASIFNGREPDDRRYDVDTDALDSYSGRLWLMPTPAWAVQVSAGHLHDAEAHDDGRREDLNRITASATYHRLVNSRMWATTLAWGQNREADHSTSALVAETAFDVTTRDVLFTRGEVVQKTAAELVLPGDGDEPFIVGKIQAGYTRWLAQGRGVRAGVGGSVGVSLVPDELQASYGGSVLGEAAVYFTIQPR
jgi:hypothetical protein